ncbi:MAG: methyltransferase family protein [Candidatus Acidiferrales bacterium]
MNWLDAVAAVLCFFYLPIPVYWLLLHPLTRFCRGRERAALWIAFAIAWSPGGAYITVLRDHLFAASTAPLWALAAGTALVMLDAAVLFRVHRELGAARLVGQAELTGSGELNTTGLYASVRHPRYAAMIAGMAGVCLIAGTLLLWATAAVWWLLVLIAIWLEERELLARFGEAYARYRARVPAFLPLRIRPRDR